MPKQRVRAKGASIARNKNMRFRIGTRKGGQSAMVMSVQQLLEALTSGSTRPRDIPKIKKVLELKGHTLAA